MQKELRKPVGSYWSETSFVRPRKVIGSYFSVFENGQKVYKPAEPWKAPPVGTRAVVIEAGKNAGELPIKYIKTYTKDGYITEPWTQELENAISPRKPRKVVRSYFSEPEPASRPVKILGAPTKVVWKYVKAA